MARCTDCHLPDGKKAYKVKFEGDDRTFTCMDALTVGADYTFTPEEAEWNGYKYWKAKWPKLVGAPVRHDPLEGTGKMITPASTVQYERSPDIYRMTVDELIEERNNAVTKKANPAYIGQLDNLIIQSQQHAELRSYLDSILQILQRLQGVQK